MQVRLPHCVRSVDSQRGRSQNRPQNVIGMLQLNALLQDKLLRRQHSHVARECHNLLRDHSRTRSNAHPVGRL